MVTNGATAVRLNGVAAVISKENPKTVYRLLALKMVYKTLLMKLRIAAPGSCKVFDRVLEKDEGMPSGPPAGRELSLLSSLKINY